MINNLSDKFLYSNQTRDFSVSKKKQLSFGANSLTSDTVDFSDNRKPDVYNDIKKQQELKLNEFSKKIQNLSRTELASEKYELCRWSGEIMALEKIAKMSGLSEVQQLRLKSLTDKLNLIFQREAEIEETLKPFHPRDTVSENSEIPEHHQIFGLNPYFRDAIEHRANNFKGLSDEEIKKVLAYEKDMENIDNEFEKLPPLEHDCIVYKGLSEQLNSFVKDYNKAFDLMEKAKVGDIVVPDTAYTYTAFERSTAERWGGEGARHVYKDGKESRIMMYEIYLPKGAKVSRNFEHNGEVLMSRGAKYKIKGKKVLKNGDIEVSLEYILPKNV